MTVIVVADDLIWSTRLASMLRSAGAEPLVVRSGAALDAALAGGASPVVIDLGSRSYDGQALVRQAMTRGCRVLAVGQHDDPALRRDALAAGAERFVPYRRLAEDGSTIVGAWLGAASSPPANREARTP